MKRVGSALAAAVCCLTLAACGGGTAAQQVSVDLSEWAVSPSPREIPAGRATFVAHNRSATMTHELALLKVDGDEKTRVKEIEDIAAAKSKEVTATLRAGRYELACLIVPGESASTVDHYAQGMHTSFTVR